MHFYSHILAPCIGVQMNKEANKKLFNYKYNSILFELIEGNYDLFKSEY